MASTVDRRFGEHVAAARRNLGLTQGELGRAVGYSAQHLSNIERGAYLPGKVAMTALARVLDFPPAALDLWAEIRALANPTGRDALPPYPPRQTYGQVAYFTPEGHARPFLASRIEGSRSDTPGVVLEALRVIRYPCDGCEEWCLLDDRQRLPDGWHAVTVRSGSAIGIYYLCPTCKEARP